MTPLSLWGKPYEAPPASGPLAGLPPQVRTIISTIASKHEITLDEVMSRKNSTRPVTRCRFEIWAILIDAGRSYPRVGRFFHMDHSTIHHGVRRYRELHPRRLEAAE